MGVHDGPKRALNSSDRAFRSYIVMDQQLGRFREAFPEAVFIIASDHGWTYSGYEHFGSPDGVFIISGPGVRRGNALNSATIRDIAPTILATIGVPISRQLEGRVLNEAFAALPAMESVGSYDVSLIARPLDSTDLLDDEDEERLRAIGYID
jgi:arylsulfatase A-like enzyme